MTLQDTPDKYQTITNLICPAWFPLQSLAVNRNVFSTNCRAFLADSSVGSIASWLLALREWKRLASSDMGSSLNGAPAAYERESQKIGRDVGVKVRIVQRNSDIGRWNSQQTGEKRAGKLTSLS